MKHSTKSAGRIGENLFSVLFGMVLFITPLFAQTPISEYVPGEVIVKFIDTATPTHIDNSRRAVKAERLSSLPLIRAHHWKLGKGVSVELALEILSKSPFKDFIEYAEPNYIYHTFTMPNDALRNELYAMHNIGQTGGTPDADIDALEAWQTTTGSADIVVGDIDTGIDYLHEDLLGNIWTNPNEIPSNGIDDDNNGYVDDVRGWDFVNNDNDPMDDNNHGSHTSGTIGAKGDNGIGVAGLSWNVKLMPLKFLNAGGSGSTDNAIKAIQYAAMFGVRITSNSWGGGNKSRALEDAIRNSGALFIAAAGNSGSSTKMYPAGYSLDNIISVAATDHNDALASFSNYGTTWVDLAAPGVSILSTTRNDGYAYFNGTSMATPHVAGVVALVLSQHPTWTNAQIKSQILNTVDALASLAGKVLTGGRLNAKSAVGASAFPSDVIAPDGITTLTTGSITDNSVTLSWTATGDDGNTGTAYAYDIRYLAGTPITTGNWSTATQATGEPLPQSSGNAESFTVTNLSGSTTYYFAIKVLDELGNVSALSNSPSATTLLALWNKEVADNTTTVGFYKSLAFDATGKQAIGYSDDANNDVELARWNGSSWTLETVDAGTDVYSGIDLAFSPGGMPSLSYGWGKLFFAQKPGSTWSITTLETKNAYNDITSHVYSPAGEATIAYRITTPPANASGLKFAKRNPATGVWTKQMVDPQAGARYNSLAYDATGKPAIAYSEDIDRDNSLETLKFAHWNGSSWDIQVVETGVVGYGVWASLAYDPITGYPAIVHGNVTGADRKVRFLFWDGTSWVLEIVDCCQNQVGYSLAFDASGKAYVCYAMNGPKLQFAKRDAPNTWIIETVDQSIAGWRYRMIFGPSGVPSIAYRGPNTGLKYAQRTSAPFAPIQNGWSKEDASIDPAKEARVMALLNMNVTDEPLAKALENLDASPSAPLPTQITLHQNYPNPFNPNTTITYSIPEEGRVVLRVFDVLGRLVTELENGIKNSGVHKVMFDGQNQASGVYHYQLEVNGQVQKRSMTLLK